MPHESLSHLLLRTVADGEFLRTHLENVQAWPGAAGRLGASVELAAFYGQAFDNMIGVIPDDPLTRTTSRLLYEAILGRIVFRSWQEFHSQGSRGGRAPVDDRAMLGRMAGYWDNIVRLVLED